MRKSLKGKTISKKHYNIFSSEDEDEDDYEEIIKQI